LLQAVSVNNHRGILKHATVPNARLPSKKTSPTRIQTKSTLTLRNSTLVLPNTQELYPPTSYPDHKQEVVAPDTTNVPTARTIPKVTRTISGREPGIVHSDPYNNFHFPRLQVNRFQNVATDPLQSVSFQRKVKSKKLSHYMQLLSPIQEENVEKQVLIKNYFH